MSQTLDWMRWILYGIICRRTESCKMCIRDSCWDNPITAGSHCIYLERDITNRLNRYSNDGSITQVWVWAEDRGDGSYDLYIGYA